MLASRITKFRLVAAVIAAVLGPMLPRFAHAEGEAATFGYIYMFMAHCNECLDVHRIEDCPCQMNDPIIIRPN